MNTETVLSKSEGGTATAEHTRSGRVFRPNVDIVEKNDELLLYADLPGADGDSIDINFEEGELSLHAKVQPRQDPDQQYPHQEYGIGDFYRIPAAVCRRLLRHSLIEYKNSIHLLFIGE